MLEFSLSSAAADTADTPCVVVGVFDDVPSPAAAAIDTASGGLVTRLRESGDFIGRIGTTLVLHGLAGVVAPRVLLVGLGSEDNFLMRVPTSAPATRQEIRCSACLSQEPAHGCRSSTCRDETLTGACAPARSQWIMRVSGTSPP